MERTIIANTGIQFIKFHLEVNQRNTGIKPIGFWEKPVLTAAKSGFNIDIAREINGAWVSETELSKAGCLEANGKLIKKIDISALTQLEMGKNMFVVDDLKKVIQIFMNEWLPVPYFEAASQETIRFGPTNWCRLQLVPISTKEHISKYAAILVFDTKTEKNNNEGPQELEANKNAFTAFDLVSDIKRLIEYFNNDSESKWFKDYLESILKNKDKDFKPELQVFPTLKNVYYYIYFIMFLKETKAFPSIHLYANNQNQAIDVDLVLDIGSSQTCGVLFEKNNVYERESLFSTAAKLQLQDLTAPDKHYNEPFDMRLVFKKNDFGNCNPPDSKKFNWPSLVRVGKEAKRLIYNSSIKTVSSGSEMVSSHSSPKRYLWDDEKTEFQWEFIDSENKEYKHVFVEGISSQFKGDGSYIETGKGKPTINYSRKSLMTFVFIEILTHAISQINSFEFRQRSKDVIKPRRLKRVLITCPTGMVKAEQIILRKCAEEAARALSKYFDEHNEIKDDEQSIYNAIKIIPSVKDLELSNDDEAEKRYWMFDEASCVQMVFLYAEIAVRYGNNCKKFFDLYGKRRSDLKQYQNKAITIGSVDIGGGTTDLMINTYKYDEYGSTHISPTPLYWESFNQAGDDLMEVLVREIIIQGRERDEKDAGCTGVIENYLRKKIDSQRIEETLNDFFALGNARMDYRAKRMRREFNIQVSIPIIEKYLAHTVDDFAPDDKIMSFKQLFSSNKPNEELLNYFENHFGFRFEKIEWKLSKRKVNNIIKSTFTGLIKKISTLLYAFNCDFVLLAGRPSSLKIIQNIFIQYFATTPDRFITLSNYRVGFWHPFHDGNGYFVDHKSTVAIGAYIALNADRLGDFILNLNALKTGLGSTANYFGIYQGHLDRIQKLLLSDQENENEIEVNNLPLKIGFKRLNSEFYPDRIIYILDFNRKQIAKEIGLQNKDIKDIALKDKVGEYIKSLSRNAPFKIKITRDYHLDKEKLKILSVIDNKDNSTPATLFHFKLKTLHHNKVYWLDTGGFNLKISSK